MKREKKDMKEKKENWRENDWCKSFFSEKNGEKKQNAAESGIHINGLRWNTYNNKRIWK